MRNNDMDEEEIEGREIVAARESELETAREELAAAEEAGVSGEEHERLWSLVQSLEKGMLAYPQEWRTQTE